MFTSLPWGNLNIYFAYRIVAIYGIRLVGIKPPPLAAVTSALLSVIESIARYYLVRLPSVAVRKGVRALEIFHTLCARFTALK